MGANDTPHQYSEDSAGPPVSGEDPGGIVTREAPTATRRSFETSDVEPAVNTLQDDIQTLNSGIDGLASNLLELRGKLRPLTPDSFWEQPAAPLGVDDDAAPVSDRSPVSRSMSELTTYVRNLQDDVRELQGAIEL